MIVDFPSLLCRSDSTKSTGRSTQYNKHKNGVGRKLPSKVNKTPLVECVNHWRASAGPGIFRPEHLPRCGSFSFRRHKDRVDGPSRVLKNLRQYKGITANDNAKSDRWPSFGIAEWVRMCLSHQRLCFSCIWERWVRLARTLRFYTCQRRDSHALIGSHHM